MEAGGDLTAEIPDCLVIGAGLAGLACAEALVRQGRSVHVVEAQEWPGGRARSVWHRGRPVDIGVQVIFGSYPRTRELIDRIGIRRADLRPVSAGVVLIDERGQRPIGRRGALGLAKGLDLDRADRLRWLRLGAEVARRAPESWLEEDGDGQTAEEFLRGRGFSEQVLDRIVRPFFTAVLFDRQLRADADYFRFLLGSMARGPALIPSDGIGMIAEWASAAVRQRGARVELGTRVERLEVDADGRRVVGARSEGGRLLRARQVVLAVEAPAAARLLEGLDDAAAARLPAEEASGATAAFALLRPLYRGRAIVVNAERDEGEGPRVDLLCQTTNVTRPRSPEGPHILLATGVTTGGGSGEGLVEAVARLVERWSPRFDWSGLAEPIGLYEHRWAQYVPQPGVRADLPGPRTALENLILAGDLTAHPSIEGAVASGFRAAGVADALIP